MSLGLIAYYHRIREWLKIYRFTASEEISRHRLFRELLARRWKSLVAVVLLIVICFFADIAFSTLLMPIIANQPWYSSLIAFLLFPDASVITSLLSSIISGIAAIIGILLAISLVVIQIAAQRYPYRMVRFIIEEKVGAYVLDYLIVSLLFSIWTLFLLKRGVSAPSPVISVFVSLILATFSIVFVFVYGQYSLYFFRPKQGFQAVALEANKSLDVFFKKGNKLGRLVIIYLREKVKESINVLTDFMEVLSKRKDEDSWYGNLTLATVLTGYIDKKRFIEAESDWFPKITVRASDNLYDLDNLYEEFAVQRTTEKTDTDWLEREVFQALGNVQNKFFSDKEGVETPEVFCLMSLSKAYSLIIESCFKNQEFSILDMTLKNVKTLSKDILQSDSLTISDFYNLLLLISESSIKGLDVTEIKKIIPSLSWESEGEILSYQLPKIFNDTLFEFRKKLGTEITAEGTIVTPREVIVAEIIQILESEKQKDVYKYYSEVFLLLESMFEKAKSNNFSAQTSNIVMLELTLVRRAIVLNKAILCEGHVDIVLNHCLSGYDILKQKGLRNDVFKQVKLGYFNSVKHRDINSAKKFFDCLAQAVNKERAIPEDSFIQEALESLMVSCSLAFLYSEFYQDKDLFESTMNALSKNYDLAKLANVFDLLLSKFEFTMMTLEYHDWFKDLLISINKLPILEDKRHGGKAMVFVHDHPSKFVKYSGEFFGIKECAKEVVKELRQRSSKP